MTERLDYYRGFNFIVQQNYISLLEMGGNWWLADTCNKGIVYNGRCMIFILAEYGKVLFRVSVNACSLNFFFIPLV